MAEPRVARPRRRQARGRRARQPVAPAPLDGRRRAATGSATAPRTTRSGSSGRWRGARSATGRRDPSARARWSASASCTSRRGRWRRWRPRPGVTTPLPMGPFPERALPAAARPGSTGCRPRATPWPRRRARTSPPRSTRLDRVFEAVTGRAAARADGDSGGGRTVAYLDCMRDLDVTLGPARARRAARSLPAGARRRRAGGAGACSTAAPSCSAAIAHGRPGPLAPLLGPLMGAGFGLWDQMRRRAARAAAPLGRWRPTSPTGRRRGTARATTPRTSRSPRPTPTRSLAATS